MKFTTNYFKGKLINILLVGTLSLTFFIAILYIIYSSLIYNFEYKVNRNLINENATKHLKVIDHQYKVFEEDLTGIAYDVIDKLKQEYSKYNSIGFNLTEFTQNHESMDLYFIDSRNYIVQSTDIEELGLDLSQIGNPEYISFLNRIRESKVTASQRIAISNIKGDLKNLVYGITDDGKYIIEVGVKINEMYDFANTLSFEYLENLIEENYDFVEDIELYNSYGISNSGQIDEEYRLNHIKEALVSNETIEFTRGISLWKKVYRYIPYDFVGELDYYQRNVIEIVYNNKSYQSYILFNLAIILCFAIVNFLFFSSYTKAKLKKILEPFDNIIEMIRNISAGDLDLRISIDSGDEFETLGNSINNFLDYTENLIEERDQKKQKLIEKNREINNDKNEIERLYEKNTSINNILDETIKETKKSYYATIKALVYAIELKDTFTKGHCDRVEMYSIAIAKRMDLSISQMENLRFGATLHDVGKIGIDEELLYKVDRLTSAEKVIYEKHPLIGYDILKDIDFLEGARMIVLQHHERIDGLGYPYGIKGNDINMLSQIVAVADAYDAMTSVRPYRREPMTMFEAIEELKSNSGTQFDEKIINEFIEYLIEDYK